ncbi:MAG TPA: hypothetical protein VH988_20360 [Thermoanaerobaculia bacterium]|jgi:hypothetical protein|nr:hypothetical protein [Thermoanaerobaculia bacterium]
MNSESVSLVSGTPRLFAERNASKWLEAARDAHGFLRPSTKFFQYAQLLQRPCTLVLAPPWIGKTFTAQQIFYDLQRRNEGERAISKWSPELTDLEVRFKEPSWLGEWKEGKGLAIWIIDALDEGQRRDQGLCPLLLTLLRQLSSDQRQRLRLLLFARETDLREVAPDFKEQLRTTFRDGFFIAELLPLDAENAKEVVEAKGLGEEDWERVLRLIKRNHLQAVSGYPAALLFLAGQRSDAELSMRDVWKGVLQGLLEEHHYPSRPFRTELESRFAAAARVAAVLTLVHEEELAISASNHQTNLSQLFPIPEPIYNLATREAAREALRSGMFRATAEGSRFLHKNVREWMAAFGMGALPLAKLRPILQDTPASSNTPATIRSEFSDLVQLLGAVHNSPEARDWINGAFAIPTDLFVQNLDGVRALLDRLEQLAVRGWRAGWIDDPSTVDRLVVPSLDEELTARLQNNEKEPAARSAILQIGAVLGLPETLVAAAAIVFDVSQDEGLRSACAFSVARCERVELLRSLEIFVEKAMPATQSEKEIVSVLLAAFVENGVWSSARVFRCMPRGPADRVINFTSALPYTLERYMTVEDADEIVSSLSGPEIECLNDAVEKAYQEGALEVEPRWKVYANAAYALISANPVDSSRLRQLISFVLSLGIYTAHHEADLIATLKAAFGSSESGRRELFAAAVDTAKEARAHGRHVSSWLHLLKTEDLGWLEDRLETIEEPGLSIALSLSEQTGDEKVRWRVRAAVRRRAPQALEEQDKFSTTQREWEQQNQERKSKEDTARRRIEDIDRELLAIQNIDAQRRLWNLSWVNFSDGAFRPRNLVGGWSDLPLDLKRQVLEAIEDALNTVIPTPVPEGSSFPSALQYEAQAFIATLRSSPERFQLTQERIQRWLPAVLRVYHQEKDALLEDCLRAAQFATEEIFLEAVARELRDQKTYSILLQDLPASLWTENITRWVVRCIEGTRHVGARPRLLELLASRRPEVGLRVARSMLRDLPMNQILRAAKEGTAAGEPDSLGMQALDILLALAPDEAWPLVEEGAAVVGRVFFDKLRGFTSNAREGLQVHWMEWPPERQAHLAQQLFAAYPPEDDPHSENGYVSPPDDNRGLRWRLLEYLANSGAAEAASALDRAKQAHPRARKFVEELQASREAGALLTGPVVNLNSRGIDVMEACRLLDDEHFRLIRSAEDLLEVVVEALGELGKDVADDHAMLYCPSPSGAMEKRRHEAALQAYVRRRLQDRLPGKILDRETQVKLGRRMDIRVIAPVVESRGGRIPLCSEKLVRLVIEVKWSDNGDIKRGVSTGLAGKLGNEYLLAEGLTHGIFLVGWMGKLGTWKNTVPHKPREKSASALAEALERQAVDFRCEHPAINIRPIVWDISRGDEKDSATRGKGRHPRSLTKRREKGRARQNT